MSNNHEAQLRAVLADHLEREGKALLEKHPEWKADPKKAQAEIEALKDGLIKNYGYTSDHLAVIDNHRNIDVARDALAWRKHQSDMLAARNAQAEKAEAKRQKVEGLRETVKNARGMRERAGAIADLVDADGKR